MDKECIEMIVGIIEIASAILVLIGASMGLSALNKWKEKQFNATFSFYSRLKTKLKLIYDIFTDPNYRNILFDRMLPQSLRSKDPGVFSPMKPIIVQKLSELADGTIDFLMAENNQMPISEKWNEQLGHLLEFLQDCGSLKDDVFFKWTERKDDETDAYYKLHSENLDSIIKDIETRQTELTKKYLKKVKSKTARKSTSSDT